MSISITSIYTDGTALERGRAFAIIFDRFLSNKAIEFKCTQDEGRVAGYAHAYFDEIIYNSCICDESLYPRVLNSLIAGESYSPNVIDMVVGRVGVHSSFQIPKNEEDGKHFHDRYKVIDLPPGIKTRRDLVRWMQQRSPGAIGLMREVVSSFSADKCFQDAKAEVEAKLSLSVEEMARAYKTSMEHAAGLFSNVNKPQERGCLFHLVVIAIGILIIIILQKGL